ncbi:hypothetical protein Vadar_018143 [Vaccinium darrowii]|uniref:Uncharacterized protein n=1 Tax=Vaccinium darrowii TaxID=229202 RepID=A0ACB7YFJ2_9ERIC|nr:hypothetical protein Vadar_018143 [Vaccinium darrowii]
MKERLEKNYSFTDDLVEDMFEDLLEKESITLPEELFDSKTGELPPLKKMTANPITAEEGDWIVYQSKGMKKRKSSSSRTKAPFVPKRPQKPKTSKKIKRTKVSKSAAKKKDPKKQKQEKLVSDEPLKQPPRICVTLEEFLPEKLQSLELRANFKKKREGAVIQVPCLNIIVISDDEEQEEGSSASRPIHILDSPTSPQHDFEECMATPKGCVTPKGTMTSPEFSPVAPVLYMNTPEYVMNSPQRYVGDAQVRSSPEDDRRAKIEGQKKRNQAKIVVSLKEEMSKTTQNYMIHGEQISSHPFPQWVEMVLFPRGYSIPHFPLDNGVGCPRHHLVHFLALCGDIIRSQALLLQQFVLSLKGWAADWYFSLPANSIPDWDTMAEQFYRRFYMPRPMEFEMWEPYENISFQAYELLEGTIEEKLEAASNQRDMGGFRARGLFPPWVEQTPFPLGYDLPNFSIYKGHGDLEKHIKIFLRQCGRTAQNEAGIVPMTISFFPGLDCI